MDSPNELENVLESILKRNPSLLEKFQSKRQTSNSYYSAKFATAVKTLADEMMSDPEKCARIFEFDNYAEFKQETLRQKLFGALQFLVDTNPAYRPWRDSVKIMTTPTGIMVKFKDEKELSGGLIFRKINKAEEGAITEPDKWKTQVISCVEMKQDEIKIIKDLNLTEENKQWVRNMFMGLTDFTVYIGKNQLKVMRGVIDENERIIDDP